MADPERFDVDPDLTFYINADPDLIFAQFKTNYNSKILFLSFVYSLKGSLQQKLPSQVTFANAF